jgi:hypothetical protein
MTPPAETPKPDQDAGLIAALYARAIEDENGCYIWQGTIASNGYGRVQVGSRTVAAHRRVLALTLGREIPLGIDACHHCDVRPCIRAEHLFEGTRSENMLDASSKGRNPAQVHPELMYFATPEGKRRRAVGSAHGSAKLTAEQARTIRGDQRSHKKIAKAFGVNASTIDDIKSGKSWSVAIARLENPHVG